MPEKRIFAKAGHVCMMCGFKATTKNKYRELQDHLVRRHFQDRIKAALPTRRPFMCPDHSCSVEGKDWQALMRHYTGKHGVLEAYIKEFLQAQAEHKENLHLGRPISPLPPTNKIGCRRRRYKRHSSGEASDLPMAAEDRTEDPVNESDEYIPQLSSPSTELQLQLDDSEPADLPPTHLALVLKRRKVGLDGLEEEEPEETYAFVDLKYFQPLSANQYIMKSEVIEPSFFSSHAPTSHNSPPTVSHCNGGGPYYLEDQSPYFASVANESFPNQTPPTTSLTHLDFSTGVTSVSASTASPIYIPSYDQVVPNQSPQTTVQSCVGEVEISTEAVSASTASNIHYDQPVTVHMEVPIQVANLDPKNHSQVNRGCSKVVVESVKSIPMEIAPTTAASTTGEAAQATYELNLPDGMKEIDFTMF